jgi:hypothetical protein
VVAGVVNPASLNKLVQLGRLPLVGDGPGSLFAVLIVEDAGAGRFLARDLGTPLVMGRWEFVEMLGMVVAWIRSGRWGNHWTQHG